MKPQEEVLQGAFSRLKEFGIAVNEKATWSVERVDEKFYSNDRQQIQLFPDRLQYWRDKRDQLGVVVIGVGDVFDVPEVTKGLIEEEVKKYPYTPEEATLDEVQLKEAEGLMEKIFGSAKKKKKGKKK